MKKIGLLMISFHIGIFASSHNGGFFKKYYSLMNLQRHDHVNIASQQAVGLNKSAVGLCDKNVTKENLEIQRQSTCFDCLFEAVLRGNVGKFDILLNGISRTQDINVVHPRYETTLLIGAVESGEIALVRRILHMRSIDVNKQNIAGSTALHKAATRASGDMVNLLLSGAHINLNIQDDFGQTPLMLACLHHNYRAIDILVTAGARVELKNKEELMARELLKTYSSDDVRVICFVKSVQEMLKMKEKS